MPSAAAAARAGDQAVGEKASRWHLRRSLIAAGPNAVSAPSKGAIARPTAPLHSHRMWANTANLSPSLLAHRGRRAGACPPHTIVADTLDQPATGWLFRVRRRKHPRGATGARDGVA